MNLWKYFLLSCFIYTTIIIQSLCFLSNLNPKITDRDYDDDILDLIKSQNIQDIINSRKKNDQLMLDPYEKIYNTLNYNYYQK